MIPQMKADATKRTAISADEPTRLNLRLFVSYRDREGDLRQMAVQAKESFEAVGHRAWVWCMDASSGGYTHEEISYEIDACDRVVYICTSGSDGSRGQRFERLQALAADKVIDIIAFSQQHVSMVLRHITARITTEESFNQTCADLAHEFAFSPLYQGVVIQAAEGEQIEPA